MEFVNKDVNSDIDVPIIVSKKTVQVQKFPGAESGEFCVPVDEKNLAPVDRIVLPSDITEIKEDDDIIYIIGTRDGKVTKIGGLERMTHLKVSQFMTHIPV